MTDKTAIKAALQIAQLDFVPHKDGILVKGDHDEICQKLSLALDEMMIDAGSDIEGYLKAVADQIWLDDGVYYP